MITMSLKHSCPKFTFSYNTKDKPGGGKPSKVKPGSAANGVNLQKDLSLATANPNARGPVNRAPGPRTAGPLPGHPGPAPGAGHRRGQ